jgi:hypothetical protein
MAGIDINVLMRESGNQIGVSENMGRAKSKLSSKESAQLKKTFNKRTNMLTGMSTFASTGSLNKGLSMSIPPLRAIKMATALADKGVNFGTKLYQSHTGEDMLVHNFTAKYKTITSVGMNILQGHIQNILYNRPLVRRRNNMLDYGREIYLRNIEGEKNQFV